MLNNLGINLNLAPVVDISTNKKDYMYERSLGENAKLTAQYAKTVIETSKTTKVSYTLKHFPGYGNNLDTHKGISIDKRSREEIYQKDLEPFREGIKAGAEAVLISHPIVMSIDNENPASLSTKIHQLLRKELNFTGVIITDDLAMKAVAEDEENVIKAIIAGNDLIITADYKQAIKAMKQGLEKEKIKQEEIDKAVFKVLAWKYAKKLL